MDRRNFLATGAAVAIGSTLPASPLFAQTAAKGDAALNAKFEDIFNEQVAAFPTFATSLGLDKGANAPLKSKLDTRS